MSCRVLQICAPYLCLVSKKSDLVDDLSDNQPKRLIQSPAGLMILKPERSP